MGQPDNAGPDVDRAVHYAVFKAATFAALLGQWAHHNPDVEVPDQLAEADTRAFDAAANIVERHGNPYDLAAVTATAYRSGQSHTGDECPFCTGHDPAVGAVIADAESVCQVIFA